MNANNANLLWTILKNAASQTGGRILLALVRFGVAVLIVQRAGLESFGDYALILSYLLVAEWLTDFGQTDIAVREMSRDRGRWAPILGAVVVTKAGQTLFAAVVLCAAVLALDYPDPVLRASLIAAGGLVFHAGVLIYRVLFRVEMRMERDVGAELVSAFVLLVAIWGATGQGASLETLILCYAGSRGVYFVASLILAGARPEVDLAAGVRHELKVIVLAGLPIGVAGLLTSLYDAMDAIALSIWSDSGEVGAFTAAMRFLILAVLAVQALSMAVFPVLARQWTHERQAFERTSQKTLESAAVIGGAIFCGLHVGAEGLASLLGADTEVATISDVLRLLSWAILARIVVTVMGPLVVIAGKQLHVVWVTAIVVLSKALALAWLVPGGGAIGAAQAYLISEVGVGLIPTIIICQHVAGFRLRWSVPVRAAAAAALVAGGAAIAGWDVSLFHGVVAACVFMVLALVIGAVRAADLWRLYLSVEQRIARGSGA